MRVRGKAKGSCSSHGRSLRGYLDSYYRTELPFSTPHVARDSRGFTLDVVRNISETPEVDGTQTKTIPVTPFNTVPDDVPKARSTVRSRRARPGRLGCSPLRRLSVSPQVRRHVRRIQAQQISWLERAAARTSNTVHAQYTTGRHDVLYKQDEAHHEDDPRSHLDHSRQVT